MDPPPHRWARGDAGEGGGSRYFAGPALDKPEGLASDAERVELRLKLVERHSQGPRDEGRVLVPGEQAQKLRCPCSPLARQEGAAGCLRGIGVGGGHGARSLSGRRAKFNSLDGGAVAR